MSLQRLSAFLLIAIEAAAVGALSQTWLFPGGCVLAAAVVTVSGKRIEPRPARDFRIVAVIILGFIAKYLVAPLEFDDQSLFIRTQLAHALAQAAIVVQLMMLLVRSDRDRLSPRVPWIGAIALVCASDVRVEDAVRLWHYALVAGYVVVAAAFYAGSRTALPGRARRRGPGRIAAGGLVLAVALSSAWAASGALHRHERDLDEIIARVFFDDERTSDTGFSGRAWLGSVSRRQTARADAIALVVESERSPEYLRGAVIEIFRRGRPAAGRSSTLLSVTDRPREFESLSPELGPVFGTAAAGADRWQVLAVRPDAEFRGRLFTPLGADRVEVRAFDVRRTSSGLFIPSGVLPGEPYRVYAPVPQAEPAPDRSERESLTYLHPRIARNEDLKRLADEVTAGCDDSEQKIAAVRRFFERGFSYALDVEIPAGDGPLTHFLLRRPPAHCEFFAAGATTLLRFSGVPCRYVTGFLVRERNPIGKHWVARNRDAHAWVEAYDERRGWVTVDCTPAAGRPNHRETRAARGLWESSRDLLTRFRNRWRIDGLVGLFVRFSERIRGVTGMVLLGGLLAVLVALEWRQRPRRRRKPVPPEVARLQRLLKRMDRRLARRQLRRRSGETLHDFAQRLASDPARRRDAEWYLRYAEIRYGPGRNEGGAALSRLPLPAD